METKTSGYNSPERALNRSDDFPEPKSRVDTDEPKCSVTPVSKEDPITDQLFMLGGFRHKWGGV